MAGLVLQVFGYVVLTVIYNLYFHPLRHYPGPLLHRASRLPRAVRILRGRWTRDLLTLTEQYGPVMRVAPDVLVYTGADAWRDIFAHANTNGAVARGEEFGKDPHFYRSRGFPPNILGESRDNHALLRRQLSHGFSDKSLRAQEDTIRGYIDLFILRLRERCSVEGGGESAGEKRDGSAVDNGIAAGTRKTAFDMKHWLNYTTFDVIGDLALGEPFGCLEKAELDPRVAYLDGGLQTANKTYFMKEIGLERLLLIIFKRVSRFRKALIQQMSAVLRKRMDLVAERPDLIEGLLSKQEDWVRATQLSCFSSLREMSGDADWPSRICPLRESEPTPPFCTYLLTPLFIPSGRRLTGPNSIIAGSETTATILSGALYLILKNPAVLEDLKKEIRSTFKSDDEITFSSVDNLPYST